jgi:hypothetical protein
MFGQPGVEIYGFDCSGGLEEGIEVGGERNGRTTRDVHTQATMDSRAANAQKDTDVGRGPTCIWNQES